MKVDYTTFRTDGKSPGDTTEFNKKWWTASKTDRPDCISRIVKFIAQYDTRRQNQYQISTRLYGNTNLMGLNGLTFAKMASVNNALKDRLSYNVIQSGIDTIVSKMAKNKPKPLFLTSGGDYKIQRRAKKLDKFVDGCFYENNAHKLGLEVFRDGTVLGDGVIHVFRENNRVKYERVIASELYMDWVEAFYGHPRQLHRVKNIDRDVLADLYPSSRKKIYNASSASADLIGGYQNVADQVTTMESWHLPSGPDATDGLHTICIEGEELIGEEYEYDHFPFVMNHWSKRLYGGWGQGAAEQIQNIQLELNKVLWVIQRSIHLGGSFKVLIENGSKIVKEYLNNDIGAIITYANTPPQWVTPPAVPIELYQQVQNLKNSAYEQLGISQLSASSQKPEGLDSGKALREFNNIESDRFLSVGQAYEQLYLDLAKLTIEVAKEIYEEEGSYEVMVPGKKFIETIDWKDIDLEDDQYTMKIFPISSLPNDPAGRLQTVQEYMQAGLFSIRQGRRLLDFPDLEQIETLQNSAEDYLHQILEKIIDDGEYTPPEPYDDLSLAKELALEYYSQGKCNALEPEKLEMLRTFLDQVDILMQKSLPPPMAGPAGATPQAVPTAPPVSDMLPNAPGGAA